MLTLLNLNLEKEPVLRKQNSFGKAFLCKKRFVLKEKQICSFDKAFLSALPRQWNSDAVQRKGFLWNLVLFYFRPFPLYLFWSSKILAPGILAFLKKCACSNSFQKGTGYLEKSLISRIFAPLNSSLHLAPREAKIFLIFEFLKGEKIEMDFFYHQLPLENSQLKNL